MSGRTYAHFINPAGTEWTRAGAADIPAEPDLRDPLKWPYPPGSYWNMPIGDDAALTALNLAAIPTNQYKFRWEEDILTLDPDATEETIMEHDAGWSGAVRCSSRTGSVLVGNGTVSDMDIPVPAGFETAGYIGTTPNHSSAHVRRRGGDVVLFECQPTHFCSDGVVVSQFVNSGWVGDSIMTGGMGVKGGSHGGSALTAFGGTIRLHEWVPGGRIPHAVKLVMGSRSVCYNHDTQAECWTWPATKADSGAVTEYGTEALPSLPPEARMGMLMTLPDGWNWEGLITEPARILARALYEYGGYLVDESGADMFMFAVEWSNEGRYITQFEADWGIKGFHQASHGAPSSMQQDFWADMDDIYTALVVVTNNSSANPGGPGSTRRAALAPALGPMP